mmetsp:Transcript_36399/g.51451  ORF Transcript_36399/g.51451 Transcript_36399/m.51451 type:complete len:526 (-) Transcript_36399:81-1658(-)
MLQQMNHHQITQRSPSLLLLLGVLLLPSSCLSDGYPSCGELPSLLTYPSGFNIHCDEIQANETHNACQPCTLNQNPDPNRRRRYEVRDLPNDHWESFVFASKEIHRLSMEEGKELYGPLFKNNEYFAGKHATAEQSHRGDQGHYGTHFLTFHAMMCLMYETTVLAITEAAGLPLEAVPYWWNFDDVNQSDILSAEYFGSHPGLGPLYEVIDGPFANWSIPLYNYSLTQYEDYVINASDSNYTGNKFGYMRTDFNQLGTPMYVAYIGEETQPDGYSFRPPHLGDTLDCMSCAYETKTFSAYHLAECFDYAWHAKTHTHLGGLGFDLPGDINGTFGDSFGPTAPTTYPIFWPFHNSVTMMYFEWIAQYPEYSNITWGFPYELAFSYVANGTMHGISATEVISAAFPFTWADVGWAEPGTDNGNKTVTHGEAFCHLTKENALFQYVPFSQATEYQALLYNATMSNTSVYERIIERLSSDAMSATDGDAEMDAAEAFLMTYDTEKDNQLESANAFLDTLLRSSNGGRKP